MRIALFTLDSAISAAAVADLLRALLPGADGPGQVVWIGRSHRGGTAAEALRHLSRSGPRLLPYLAVNYALPQALGAVRRDPLRRIAAAAGIPVAKVAAVNGPETAAALRAARPDLILSFHFDQIFAPATLAIAPLGGINLHPSLLPRHRGPVPTIWALAEDPPAFGATVHRLAPRIDAGTLLAQRAVPLAEGITASAAARALHAAGVPLVLEALATLRACATAPAGASAATVLPYCPFPPPGLLRALARRGRRTTDLADLRAALAGATG